MPNLTSPARAIFANKANFGPVPVDTWNPLTGALASRDVNAVKFGVWLGGITNLNVQPAYQFSDDGVDWSGPVYKKSMTTGSATKTTEEWTWGDQPTYFTLPGAGETGAAFVRFGVIASTTATKDAEYAEARIYVAWRTVDGNSLECPPTRVWTSNPNAFIALTGPLPAGDVAEARAELELSGIATGITVKPAFQQVDDPGVDTDWGTAGTTEFGSPHTTNGLFPAAAFSALTPTRQYVRFGVTVNGTGILSCFARARFDWR